MKKIILFLILVSFMFSCSKKEKKLIVATDATYVPFEFYEDNKMVGFEIDLINLITSKLKREISIIDIPFSTVLMQINKGEFDIGMGGITITEERKKTLNFSDPYYFDTTVFIVNEDDNRIKNLDDLKTLKSGAKIGSTQDIYLDSVKEFENLKFKDTPNAIMNLKAKKVDVVLADKSTATIILKNNDGIKIVENLEIMPAGMGFIVSNENKDLIEKLNVIINDLEKSGKLEELKEKWGL